MTDYADLVSRLKLRAKHVSPDYVLDVEAADAIETLVRERDEARAERDADEKEHQKWSEYITRRTEAAEAEVKRLTRQISEIMERKNAE